VKPYLLLRADELESERPAGQPDDVHFTEALVASVVEDATSPGDLVLDPFAGYGTTLAVATRLGRAAVGVELLAEHAELARQRAPDALVAEGDARRLGDLLRGVVDRPVDLVLTSPPYMTAVGHPENPLTGYATEDGHYPTYLYEMSAVFAQVATLLRPGGRAVVNVANLANREREDIDQSVTPLAWDLGRAISAHLEFQGETFLCWDRHPPGHAGDYLLWFGKALTPRDPR
jgi:DNA modification methylase